MSELQARCDHRWSDNPLFKEDFCLRCFLTKSEFVAAQEAAIQPISEDQLGIMAQAFYEATCDSGDVLYTHMTAKRTIVEGIRAALQKVGKA